MSLDLTDHRGVQEGGDVEDLVQSQRRVDAFVLLASAEQKTRREGGGVIIFFSKS